MLGLHVFPMRFGAQVVLVVADSVVFNVFPAQVPWMQIGSLASSGPFTVLCTVPVQ